MEGWSLQTFWTLHSPSDYEHGWWSESRSTKVCAEIFMSFSDLISLSWEEAMDKILFFEKGVKF